MTPLFQIIEVTETHMHAGSKATDDVAVISESIGFEPITIVKKNESISSFAKFSRQIDYYRDWKKAFRIIQPNSIVLLQHPFHHRQLSRNSILDKLKKNKNVRFISLVHDVEELRQWLYNDYYQKEFNFMVSLSDAFIVHNEVMKRFFIDKGVDESKLVTLNIFDYLQDELTPPSYFDKSITIAGNLDTSKSAYIGQLGGIGDVKVNLYGIHYDEQLSRYDNIVYHGAFPADEIPKQMTAGFGLIWDGSSIESCTGSTGQYLRYNNPHKLSLYLSSGMPVIIWKQAAEAQFVEEHNLGYTVDSLLELDNLMQNLTEEDYNQIQENVVKVSKKLVSGFYTKKAIEEAEKILCDGNQS